MAQKSKAKVKPKPKPKAITTLKHDRETRKNIPTAELQAVAQRQEEDDPFAPVQYPRAEALEEGETRARNEDSDPQIIWRGATLTLTQDQIAQLQETGKIEIGDAQLVWRGKDQQDWTDLVVQAPPIYVQEKIHPKAIIDDLKRQTVEKRAETTEQPDLFGDFNGLPDPEAKTEFYQHDQHWSNRMILGDSLHVMASLAEREGLRGKVQCIYFDPPYGIKFNSNWQVSTRSRDVKDGKQDQLTREPEQVKAFRDTWKEGIHSYLAYLRDRLTVMRDLLTESGSIFVQIGDENVHRVRAVMDEVFRGENFVSQIAFTKGAAGLGASGRVSARLDYILWYGRSDKIKYRPLYEMKDAKNDPNFSWIETLDGRLIRKARASELEVAKGRYAQDVSLTKPGPGSKYKIDFEGHEFDSGSRWWGTPKNLLKRACKSGRIIRIGNSLRHLRYLEESGLTAITNFWGGFLGQYSPVYVVQTNIKIVQRCIQMTTDPGDLVLDPTCGSGTTAAVAEQWGRRWITIDTSRVATALARTRLMAARFPYYHLRDSFEGRAQEQKVSGKIQPDTPTFGDIRQGFVYERAPHITLKSIANNAEIDVIWDNFQTRLEPLRAELNAALQKSWEEWEIPRDAEADWPDAAKQAHLKWWDQRIARQKAIDTSSAQKADVELLYDRPYEDKSKIRVTGPFTVESLSPHRVVPAEDDELIDMVDAADGVRSPPKRSDDLNDFTNIILENLQKSGVQQGDKKDRISFSGIEGWPGHFICAQGTVETADGKTQRAGIFIGPEFGTVLKADLTAAAREALDAGFDMVIACGFNFDALTTEMDRLGPVPILKAKMNPDLHMSKELRNTGAGNLFIVFGEPDIAWDFDKDGKIIVEVLGVDVFDTKTGEVRDSGKEDIAAWFIDTDYDMESFFVRHAYFMGANDPYQSLKGSLGTDIDQDAWASLYRDTSRPFEKPKSGRFAVKVINHFGDEVMKVFGV